MAIKGLTHQRAEFPEIGQLRKGAEKPNEKQPGKDLTYFRFTSELPDVVAAFESAYDGEPRLINVFLPFRHADDCWEAWQEEYKAGGLVHRCDGETAVLWQKQDGSYSTEKKPCPGGCKPTGRLKVIIPELRRLAYVTVLTTSWHDIRNLDAQLRALESLRGDLTGIPLQLRRRPHKISTPSGNGGKRVRREKWLLSIEAAPQWVDLQLEAQQAAAIPQLPSGPAPEPVVDVVTGEIVEDELPWDAQVFDAGEDEPELPPDFLVVRIPEGSHQHAGQTIGWLLENDRDYLNLVAASARDREVRESALAALEWANEIQAALPM